MRLRFTPSTFANDKLPLGANYITSKHRLCRDVMRNQEDTLDLQILINKNNKKHHYGK